MNPHSIPQQTPASINRGDAGTAVFAVQRALNALPYFQLEEDGAFGPMMEVAVKRYQSTRSLTPDGKVGPKTQARLARSLIAAADPDKILPEGLARSMVEGESANFIAAVNWRSPGGCDCGYTQRRVYEPYDETSVIRAFDSLYQLKLLRERVHNLKGIFRDRPAVHSVERAYRLAICAHNFPAGADRLSRTEEIDLISYWRVPQTWVVNIGARFDDGHVVQTPLDWLKYYGLGSPEHKHHGRMCRWVRIWA